MPEAVPNREDELRVWQNVLSRYGGPPPIPEGGYEEPRGFWPTIADSIRHEIPATRLLLREGADLVVRSVSREAFAKDPDFRLTRENTRGYEDYLDYLVRSVNEFDLNQRKQWIDRDRKAKADLAVNSGFLSSLVAEVVNPVNWIPVGLAAGMTWKGASKVAAKNFPLVLTGEEIVRHASDPYARMTESVGAVALGSIIGTGLIGVGFAGSAAFKRRAGARLRRFTNKAFHRVLQERVVEDEAIKKAIDNTLPDTPERAEAMAIFDRRVDEAETALAKVADGTNPYMDQANDAFAEAADDVPVEDPRLEDIKRRLEAGEGDTPPPPEITSEWKGEVKASAEQELANIRAQKEAFRKANTYDEYVAMTHTKSLGAMWGYAGEQFPYFRIMNRMYPGLEKVPAVRRADGREIGIMQYIREQTAKTLMPPGLDPHVWSGPSVEALASVRSKGQFMRLYRYAMDQYADMLGLERAPGEYRETVSRSYRDFSAWKDRQINKGRKLVGKEPVPVDTAPVDFEVFWEDIGRQVIAPSDEAAQQVKNVAQMIREDLKKIGKELREADATAFLDNANKQREWFATRIEELEKEIEEILEKPVDERGLIEMEGMKGPYKTTPANAIEKKESLIEVNRQGQEDLERAVSAYKSTDRSDDFWHIMYDHQKLLTPEGREGLTKIFETHYAANPLIHDWKMMFKNQWLKEVSDNPIAVRIRAEETVFSILDDIDLNADELADPSRVNRIRHRFDKHIDMLEKKYGKATERMRHPDGTEVRRFDNDQVKEMEFAEKYRYHFLEAKLDMVQQKVGKQNLLHGVKGMTPEMMMSKTRISPALVKDYIILDPTVVMNKYYHDTSNHLVMAQMFGDPYGLKYVDDIEVAGRTEIADAVEAGHMSVPEGQQAIRELTDIVDAAERVRRQAMHINPDPHDFSEWGKTVSDLAINANVLSYLGSAGISAWADLMLVVSQYGLRSTFRQLGDMIRDPVYRQISKRDSEIAGLVHEVLFAERAASLTGAAYNRFHHGMGAHPGSMSARPTGSNFHDILKRKANTSSKWTQRFMQANLLGPFTDTMTHLVVGLSQDRILRIAERMVKGKATRVDLRDARAIGMDHDLAADFIFEWSNVGATKYKRGGKGGQSLYMSDFKKWADQDTAWKFRAILQSEVNNAVLRPTMAERPMALVNPYMRMLLLYKQFAITITNRMLGRSIEQRQLQALTGVIAGLGLGVIINSLRQPDYMDKDMDEILFDALQTSGMLGIFMEANDAVERITAEQYGLRPLLGLKGYNAGDASPGQRLGALGPVLGQWSALGEAAYNATQGDFSGRQTAAAVMDFLPTQNFWAWRSQMRQLERGFGSALEGLE